MGVSTRCVTNQLSALAISDLSLMCFVRLTPGLPQHEVVSASLRTQCALLPVPGLPPLPELRAGEISNVLARSESSIRHEGSRYHGMYLSVVSEKLVGSWL